MNYRHAFHAGNFADVVKHAVLVLLLRALNAKDKPWCYVETHAGGGRYDLLGEAASKTHEWRDGIGRLWDRAADFPELADYFAAVRAANASGAPLRHYPGSPLVARQLLRADDRALLCELVPEEVRRLARILTDDARFSVHEEDGYAALRAWLPPRERRGLVLIDPPYESPAEFDQVLAALLDAHRRWASGMFAIWYPVKDRGAVARFHRQLAASGLRKVLRAELGVFAEDSAFRLNGCGMLVVNPPWQLDSTLAGLLPRLLTLLRQSPEGHASVEWLVPE